jgi:hypothetical protein
MSETSSPVHWRYFLSLEEDVVRLSRFVEFSKQNYATFSVEMTRLVLSAGSEVDVVAKQLCRAADTASEAQTMNQYRPVLRAAYPQIEQFTVEIPRFGLSFGPWRSWTHDENPPWWRAYNHVKHHRHERFGEANLENTLGAMAGLLVLVLHLHRSLAEMGQLIPNPILYRPADRWNRGTTFWGADHAICYSLAG